jgi:hypothetical protein
VAFILHSPSTFPYKPPLLTGDDRKNFAGKALDVGYLK